MSKVTPGSEEVKTADKGKNENRKDKDSAVGEDAVEQKRRTGECHLGGRRS